MIEGILLLRSLAIIWNSDVHFICQMKLLLNTSTDVWPATAMSSAAWCQRLQNYIRSDRDCSIPSTPTDAGKHYTVFYKDTCNQYDYHQLNQVLDTMFICFSTIQRRCHITIKFYLSSYSDLKKMYSKLNMLKVQLSQPQSSYMKQM